VRCEGRVIAKGRQILSTEAKLLDRDGKVLAHGTSTVMGFRPPVTFGKVACLPPVIVLLEEDSL
jgi:hypothetical protein